MLDSRDLTFLFPFHIGSDEFIPAIFPKKDDPSGIEENSVFPDRISGDFLHSKKLLS